MRPSGTPRGDRDQQLGFAEFLGDLARHRIDDLWLDREDDDLGKITECAVIRRDLDIEIPGDGLTQLVAYVAGHDAFFIHQTGSNDSSSDGRADFSRTDHADFFRQHWRPPWMLSRRRPA
jgi:hypothetical protein